MTSGAAATRIVVVGSGVAGASAAIAASSASSASAGEPEVVVVDGGTGASTLAPGALDDESGGDAGAGSLPFAGFALGACRLATMAGIVRRAAGRDLALLDLDAIGDGLIAVPSSAHHGWDARILAAQWNDSPLAGRFVPIDATLLRFTDERDMPDADLARRHDDPARIAWLGERLREALATSSARSAGRRLSAVILPPWLGAASPRADALSAIVGIPTGEALAATLGPSGLRFEAARDRAFAERGVRVRRARAKAIGVAASGELEVHLEGDGEDSISAGAIILATGGLVGGGLRYTPSGSDLAFAVPTRGRATVELDLAVDAALAPLLTIGVGGRPLLAPGSLFGASPEQLAWPFTKPAPLERAGVLSGVLAGESPDRPGFFVAVAGELAADLPRTWLAAVVSGQRAGRAAAAAVSRDSRDSRDSLHERSAAGQPIA